jgi:hypothetical protein
MCGANPHHSESVLWRTSFGGHSASGYFEPYFFHYSIRAGSTASENNMYGMIEGWKSGGEIIFSSEVFLSVKIKISDFGFGNNFFFG